MPKRKASRLPVLGKEMFDLIEIELTRVRRMAERADGEFLVYLIDMAIIEANAKARSPDNSLETLIPRSQEPLQSVRAECKSF
jgi:hypothetical protein